jgi:hypothetical protein
MPVTIEIDESNGNPSELVTHGITSLAMGTVDQAEMAPGSPGARQPPNSSSMQKALRVHLTDLGGSVGLSGLRAFADPAVAGWSWWTNAHVLQANYDATKITTYVPPSASEDEVPHPLPTSDPLEPNLGIAGSLTGELAAPGQSDYLYLQLRASAAVVAGFSSPVFVAYDESG